jgi:uncharacterized protein
MVGNDTIERAGRLLGEAAGRESKVILFGSHARGDAGPGSDLDFLVIEPEVPSRHDEMVRLRRVLRGLGVAADILVVSEAHAAEWGGVRGTAVNAALEEGVLIHGE